MLLQHNRPCVYLSMFTLVYCIGMAELILKWFTLECSPGLSHCRFPYTTYQRDTLEQCKGVWKSSSFTLLHKPYETEIEFVYSSKLTAAYAVVPCQNKIILKNFRPIGWLS